MTLFEAHGCLQQLYPMKSILLSWLFLISLLQNLSGEHVLPVSAQCLEDQKHLLLRLKDSLTGSAAIPPSSKLVGWNSSSIDCCRWDGVTCDSSGHVIKLELDNTSLSGEIANSSSLFNNFQYLESLNLACNFFNSTIPNGLFKLKNLKHLNLSNAGFVGQIPSALGSMRKLVTLDLSTRFPVKRLQAENPSLKILFQNLTELTELYLGGVNISAAGSDWCTALSSLSNLRVLSLFDCHLSGPIDDSLLRLSSLSVINLDNNNLSTTVPDFFAKFTNLTALSLSSCSLQGNFPKEILQVPTLQNLDLSLNNLLRGVLPGFPMNRSFKTIALSYTNFSGSLPNSIGSLGNLSKIDLSNSNFSGPIPSTVENLTELVYLDFSFNNFNGSLPSFRMFKSLKYMDLSRNHLTGTISSTHFDGLVALSFIDLGFNSLEGVIPTSLFTLQSLQKLQLSNNKFAGQIHEFSNAKSSSLDSLDLSGNRLNGSIPKSFFNLEKLNVLSVSYNDFSGALQLGMISSLCNLTKLELSYNRKLLVNATGSNSSQTKFPQLSILKLASCNLKTFPNLENQTKMTYLDLSNNQIGGPIPPWIWKVGNGNLQHLNLSGNLLSGQLNGYTNDGLTNLVVFDLHSNQLQGAIPTPPVAALYADYSNNNFSNSIPDIGHNFIFLSLSNNSLSGAIRESICDAAYLQFLDLSNNALTGSIPHCVFERMKNLKVLHLDSNKLNGSIPDSFPANCVLKTLDLGTNRLRGRIPSSLVNCTSLEVLNIGNNKVEDTFPCMLENSSSLRVLVLRSNMFQGNLSCSAANNGWQNLQIIDVASNNFSGALSSRSISKWRGMRSLGANKKSAQDHLSTVIFSLTNIYYQDTLTVTVKGLELELVKILTVFTSIDLSCNKFEGNIPDTLGELKALIFLNLSHNNLSGTIPNSIGNLTGLESLDLSTNQLTGTIPTELTGLAFLSFLNLSYNHLFGRIPTGSQLGTFTETSFEGNSGLCGIPLNKSCNGNASNSNNENWISDTNTKYAWQFIFTGLGFGVGAAVIIAPLIACKEMRDWCDQHLEKNIELIFPRYKFCYTRYDEGKVEAANNFEDDFLDDTEDSDADDYEVEHEAVGGKYCVFCSKVDLYTKKVVHDPNCTCHSAPPVYFTSPPSSSVLILYHQKF